MGTFRYLIEVGDPQQRRFVPLEAWVDSGATYTWIPSDLLSELGYSPQYRRRFRTADGRIVERDVCEAWIRIGSEIQHTLCVFGDSDSQPLLGAYTLEGFSLGIDPVNRQLVPVISNLLGATYAESQSILVAMGQAARAASRQLAKLSTDVKNRALLNMAQALLDRQHEILQANKQDCEAGKRNGLTDALLDRLLLTPDRIQGIASDVRSVAALPDPVGEVFDMRTLPNGLMVGKKRVPLGVLGAIYESRPNVTVDIASLCIKSGNACILRGGREAVHSNTTLAKVVREAIAIAGIPRDAVQFIENTDRSLVNAMLALKDYIDLLVPRGGADFIRYVAQNASMPVLAGGIGVCHLYVDKSADLKKAMEIAYNAKVQRPTVCNALDCLLVHTAIARDYLPMVAESWAKAGVEMRCDMRAMSILGPRYEGHVVPATQEDWGKEYLSLKAAVKVVDSLEEALQHIETYGSGHSEAIVTEDYSAAMRFLDEVDAAVVYANASTRFTDGAQFGLGAEVGISTQKFHARGPLGLREITSYKWIVFGQGHVRP